MSCNSTQQTSSSRQCRGIMSRNIVEEWLKSLDLTKHSQSFLDNGYDDLEICKQIGDPDLDAIGVSTKAERTKLLEAVKILTEQGGTAVYLTLEEESRNKSSADNGDTDSTTETADKKSATGDEAPAEGAPAAGQDVSGEATVPQLVSYPKLQLTMLLRDKLLEDDTDLASPPYTGQNLAPCWSSLTALAVKYAEDIRTYMEDVLDRLEDLRWWRITEDTASIYTPPSMTSSTQEDPYYPSLYSCSLRGGPPPIPSVPPPDGSHVNCGYTYGELTSVSTRHGSPGSHGNYATLDTARPDGEKKKTSTLGKLFRNIGFRRSNRKHAYRKHQGDLMAHEITMGDSDRIALMQMVKEGKISTETALQVVKKFEEERKKEDSLQEPVREKEKTGQGKNKKSSLAKPTKSPSAVYTDGEVRCEICNNVLSGNYGSNTWRDHMDCCRHRRVHSVSHIACTEPLRSPETGRAISCSPMRSHSTQVSALNSPVSYASPNHGGKIYTPVIPHELKMFSGPQPFYAVHGIDVLRDRLNVIKTSACVHKTPSKASLLSSGSDHSMECSSLAANQLSDLCGPAREEPFYCCNSAVSVGSDTSPATNGRRKCGNVEKMYSSKWQRTGSTSTGAEDGMSTDNDDQDDPDRRLLGHGSGGFSSLAHVSEKFRDVRNEIRKRILLQARGDPADNKQAPGTNHSVGMADSGHSASSSGYGSQSSAPLELSWQQQQGSTAPYVVVGHARVHTDYTPGPEERYFLDLKRGDRVQILEINNSGVWRGIVNNRVGFFRYSYIDMVADNTPLGHRKERSQRRMNRRSKPRSVDELLQRIGVEHLTNVFLLNGYDNLEIFAEVDNDDLNALGILDSESRAKILTAAELLMDYEALDTPEPASTGGRSASATPTCLSQDTTIHCNYLPVKPSSGSRDSGCYDSNEYLLHRELAEVYSSIKGRTSSVDNKENQKPSMSRQGLKMGMKNSTELYDTRPVHSNGASHVPHVKQRTDRVFSEEDREVCDITHGYSSNAGRSVPRLPSAPPLGVGQNQSDGSQVLNRNFNLNILPHPPTADWRYFANACTQTWSQRSFSSDMDVSGGTDMTSSIISQELGIYSTGRSKPFPKRVRPPPTPLRDAQVQVMSPLGLFTQLPISMATGSRIAPPPPMQTLTGNQPPLTNTGTATGVSPGQDWIPARLSYSSQVSREGDSGSDTNTVRSDRLLLDPAGGADSRGRNTPDSLYGPIHKGFKSIKRSLIPRVTSKLASENIELDQEPYSSQIGACGIPPLLVQRYAEELKQDIYRVALILDQVRIHKLSTLGRPVIPADQLAETSSATSELKISSIQEFFVSIGLPMYAEMLCSHGHTSVESLTNLSIKDLQSITKADRKHMKRMIHALEWVQHKLASPSIATKDSPVKDKV